MKIQSYGTTSNSVVPPKETGVSYLFQINGVEEIIYLNRSDQTGKVQTSWEMDYEIRDNLPFIPLEKVPKWARHWCFLHIFEGEHYNR
jgi:hypothetical protein